MWNFSSQFRLLSFLERKSSVEQNMGLMLIFVMKPKIIVLDVELREGRGFLHKYWQSSTSLSLIETITWSSTSLSLIETTTWCDNKMKHDGGILGQTRFSSPVQGALYPLEGGYLLTYVTSSVKWQNQNLTFYKVYSKSSQCNSMNQMFLYGFHPIGFSAAATTTTTRQYKPEIQIKHQQHITLSQWNQASSIWSTNRSRIQFVI